MKTTIMQSTLTLPVTRLGSLNPLPQFAAQEDKPFRDGGLLEAEKPCFGKHTGFRVLPYAMQDRYEGTPSPQAVKTIVLENAHLRATFLPAYGGRLYSLWDKHRQRDCLYVNSALTLRNLALRNAWFSGGVEWNFGHFGHTYFTSDSVFFAACTDETGQAFLRMYEYERCKQLTFQVDFHLPEGATALTVHLSVYNTQSKEVPIFLWTNTAVPQEAGMQVYSGTDEVIAMHMAPKTADCYLFHGRVPGLTADMPAATDPTTPQTALEYFFQNPSQPEAAFEAVQYPDGRLFVERSTTNCPYRKMFCWGTHEGGKRWQQFLAGPGSGDYLEVQAGISPTQEHGYTIGPKCQLHITQQFSSGDMPPAAGPYPLARAAVQRATEALLPIQALDEMHGHCLQMCQKPADTLLHMGRGWGALEKMRDQAFLPGHLHFPEASLEAEQAPWVSLLQGKSSDGYASFLVAEPWIALMEKAESKTPALFTQLGIAYLENGRVADSIKALEASIEAQPSSLALRCLAQVYWRANQPAKAKPLMERALALLSAEEEALRPYAEEYLLLLRALGLHQEAFSYYQALPSSLQKEEQIQLNVAASAYAVREDAFLEKLFTFPFSGIKEGENALVDLWYAYTARKQAEAEGVALTEARITALRSTTPPPFSINFSMA